MKTRIKMTSNLPEPVSQLSFVIQLDAETCALGSEGLGSSPGLHPFLRLCPWTSYFSSELPL